MDRLGLEEVLDFYQEYLLPHPHSDSDSDSDSASDSDSKPKFRKLCIQVLIFIQNIFTFLSSLSK
jgi:hypothetical protein